MFSRRCVGPTAGEVKPYRARWNVSDREAAAAGWSALDRLLKLEARSAKTPWLHRGGAAVGIGKGLEPVLDIL
jgi:hypothetical protein